MTKSDGTCKIDGVVLGEATLFLLSPAPTIIAKYALTSSSTGERFGAGNRNVWSEETFTKMKELVGSMERDICKDLFGGAATVGSVDDPVPYTTDSVRSL